MCCGADAITDLWLQPHTSSVGNQLTINRDSTTDDHEVRPLHGDLCSPWSTPHCALANSSAWQSSTRKSPETKMSQFTRMGPDKHEMKAGRGCDQYGEEAGSWAQEDLEQCTERTVLRVRSVER